MFQNCFITRRPGWFPSSHQNQNHFQKADLACWLIFPQTQDKSINGTAKTLNSELNYEDKLPHYLISHLFPPVYFFERNITDPLAASIWELWRWNLSNRAVQHFVAHLRAKLLILRFRRLRNCKLQVVCFFLSNGSHLIWLSICKRYF